MEQRRKIAILGVTGSIGQQALEVLNSNKDKFDVVLVSGHKNIALLKKCDEQFSPQHLVVTDYTAFKEIDTNWHAQLHFGEEKLCELLENLEIDILLTAMVGIAGLKPTLVAVQKGIDIALANKETLVVAGSLIMPLAKVSGSNIIPVDSEHSAIYQCLIGESNGSVEKLILTASGGPFRNYTKEQLNKVNREDALKHPNWTMGSKITIDSATLMNKGLEVIEASWLFDIMADKIEVIVHPQSVIHSMVQFNDGSIKAQMGVPDMKLPIHYALNYPNRNKTEFERFDFLKYPSLTFEKVRDDLFPCLKLAYKSLALGGVFPCILNTTNEVAVAKFLNNGIHFLDIAVMVATELEYYKNSSGTRLEDFISIDKEIRAKYNSITSSTSK